jgi:predicted nucleic acid-binding Zn ribbon protein
MFRKDVKSLTEILGQCLRENGLETPMNQTHVIESWEKVAGPVVARYTEDKYIRNQTLFVKITNPALRADLSMMKTQLVSKLNQETGSFVIADIRFC